MEGRTRIRLLAQRLTPQGDQIVSVLSVTKALQYRSNQYDQIFIPRRSQYAINPLIIQSAAATAVRYILPVRPVLLLQTIYNMPKLIIVKVGKTMVAMKSKMVFQSYNPVAIAWSGLLENVRKMVPKRTNTAAAGFVLIRNSVNLRGLPPIRPMILITSQISAYTTTENAMLIQAIANRL